MAASSISRIKKINFFGPQEVSHCSLWTSSEPNDTQTAACGVLILLVPYMPLARTRSNFLLVAGPVTRELRRVTLDLSSCEQPSKSLRALRLTEISTTSFECLKC